MTPVPAPDMDEQSNSEALSEFAKLSPKEQAEILAKIEEGRADFAAGRWLPLEAVRDWLLSWGSGNELPPPECP